MKALLIGILLVVLATNGFALVTQDYPIVGECPDYPIVGECPDYPIVGECPELTFSGDMNNYESAGDYGFDRSLETFLGPLQK